MKAYKIGQENESVNKNCLQHDFQKLLAADLAFISSLNINVDLLVQKLTLEYNVPIATNF